MQSSKHKNNLKLSKIWVRFGFILIAIFPENRSGWPDAFYQVSEKTEKPHLKRYVLGAHMYFTWTKPIHLLTMAPQPWTEHVTDDSFTLVVRQTAQAPKNLC